MQVQVELVEEIGFRADELEKLVDFYSHPGYIAYKVQLLVAYVLEWELLEMGKRYGYTCLLWMKL